MTSRTPCAGERYRHYKGGEYEILALAEHTESKETLVIHRSIEHGSIRARPLSIFQAPANRDGQEVPRFTLIQGVGHGPTHPLPQDNHPEDAGIELSFPESYGINPVS